MSMVTSKSRRKSDFVSFFFYRFLVGLIILSCCWSPTKKSGGVAVVSALIIPQQHHPQRPTSSTSTSSLHQRARTASSTTTSSHVTSTSRVNLIPIQHQRHQLQSSPFRKSSSSSTTTSSTQLCALMDVVGVSPEPIHTAFTVATFFPQPFWLLIILLPNWNVTKKIMGGLGTFMCCNNLVGTWQERLSFVPAITVSIAQFAFLYQRLRYVWLSSNVVLAPRLPHPIHKKRNCIIM